VATEYEVNIKLNTKQITNDLNTIGGRIKDLGKTQNTKAKKALSNSDAVLKKELSILATENRALRTKGQLIKLEKDGISFKNQISKLDNAINLARKGEVDFAKTIIQKQERAGILRRNQLATETKITEQKSKQVALSTGIASPVFGKPSQIGSPTNIASILNNPLTPDSPVQQALKKMDDKTKSDQKQAEINRKKSLSMGKNIVKIKVDEGKAIAKNLDLEGKQVVKQSQRLNAAISPKGDFSRLSDRQSRNKEGGRTFMNNRFARAGIPMPTQGFDTQSALISGAFPLLFGQGPIGAAAGALGGGVGGMFGGMGGFAGGIAATAVVQQIQSALNAMSELGQAMGPFTQNTESVTAALGLQGSAEEARIKLIEESEGKTAAFNASMQLMANRIGKDGVDSLKEFGDTTRLMNGEFTLAITKIQAFTAGIANFVLRITGLQENLNAAAATRTVADAAAGGNAAAQDLVSRRETIERMGSRGGEANRKAVLLEQLEIDEKIFAIMQNTTVEADVMTQKFDELVNKITQEGEETERILELRRQGLNPEIAKTIAGLEKEAKTSKESLEFEVEKLLQKQREVGILNEEDQTRLITLEKQKDAIDDAVDSTRNQVEATYDLNKAAEETLDAFERMKTTIQTDIKDGIKGLIKGTSTLGDLVNNVADRFLDIGLNFALFGNAGGSTVTGGLFKFLGFANGGRPPVGKPSVVGERGPELFVPDSSGTIVPNHNLGGSTNIVVNVDASGSNVEGDEDQGRELGRLISVAVQSELIQQQRPGGLLA